MIEDANVRNTPYLHTQFPPDDGSCFPRVQAVQNWEFEMDAYGEGRSCDCIGYALKNRCQLCGECALGIPFSCAGILINFSASMGCGTCTALSGLRNLVCLPTACCCPDQYNSSVNRTLRCGEMTLSCLNVSAQQTCNLAEFAVCCPPLFTMSECIYEWGYAQRLLDKELKERIAEEKHSKLLANFMGW